ncbi:Mini-ribonuclease 3 [Paenibacillus sp. y28]|uniref:Mini-ribonuclease 3 n=1 Tax=Paenibacillus sp. y28 TaxID=3129110 RepID=UPI00301B4AFC
MDMNRGLLLFSPSRPAGQLPPLVLAYAGDAIYEMLVRQYLISRTQLKPNHLHRESTRFVSAKAQSRFLQEWMPHLTEEEIDVVKRGRNAKSGTVPKNADVLDYRHATAFECLIGYLYYEGRLDRLEELLGLIIPPTPQPEEELARGE